MGLAKLFYFVKLARILDFKFMPSFMGFLCSMKGNRLGFIWHKVADKNLIHQAAWRYLKTAE